MPEGKRKAGARGESRKLALVAALAAVLIYVLVNPPGSSRSYANRAKEEKPAEEQRPAGADNVGLSIVYAWEKPAEVKGTVRDPMYLDMELAPLAGPGRGDEAEPTAKIGPERGVELSGIAYSGDPEKRWATFVVYAGAKAPEYKSVRQGEAFLDEDILEIGRDYVVVAKEGKTRKLTLRKDDTED